MRAAIIGLGAISTVHYHAILRAGGTVVSLCDIAADAGTRFAAQTGCGAPVYADWRQMLSSVRPDVVHICTPHYLHAEMCIGALEAGCHVLCEKPLCIREEDIARIQEAERRSGKTLGVCLQNRYSAAHIAARELLGGETAQSGFASVVWNRDAAYYRSGAWRGKWETEGGGVLINQALHTLDLLLWMMGDPDTVIATTEERHLPGIVEVEDTASALFRYRDGRVCNFFATTASGADMPVQLMLTDRQGHCIVSGNDTLTVDGCIRPAKDGGIRYGKDVWGDGHARLVDDLYRAIREGRPFAIDSHEGARVVRAILAIYRSGGQEVALAPAAQERSIG